MEWLLIAIVCGIVCALVAPGRGRNSTSWFFIGLLIGVFGIMLLALLPERDTDWYVFAREFRVTNAYYNYKECKNDNNVFNFRDSYRLNS